VFNRVHVILEISPRYFAALVLLYPGCGEGFVEYDAKSVYNVLYFPKWFTLCISNKISSVCICRYTIVYMYI